MIEQVGGGSNTQSTDPGGGADGSSSLNSLAPQPRKKSCELHFRNAG